MAEHFGNDAPNNRQAEQSSPTADQSMGHENQADGSTARDMADEFDTLVALLRQPAPSDTFTKESACQRAVEAIRQLGRTSNPSEVGPARSTDDETPALRALGQYQLLEKLGEGGMGAVYRALHTRLEKVVAVKVLPAGRVGDAEAIARFSREMKAVGRLNHPNIVGAFDAGEIDGLHYLVMELVDGQDLGAIIRRAGPLPVADACEAVRQAALGLDHAHSHGLVHRDVKPSNLMLTRQGEVKILDLGLARLAEQIPGGKELTSTGQMMGTFEYMAPEQGSDSHTVDHRADVYALGATLYKLLAGRAPFAGERYDTPLKRMMALATEDPEPIRQTRPDVPKGLARLIHRMLARDPDHRTATAREVAELLSQFAAGADLAGLVARADEASPAPAVEPGTASTQPAASSAMEHTPHTVQLSPSAAFRPQASRLRRLAAWFGCLPPVARFGLTAAAGAAGIVLLAVLLTLETAQGTLVIESDDPNVEVLVKQNGQVIDIVSAERGWKVGLKDGKYDVELGGGADSMRLSEDQVTLIRGGRTVLQVTKRGDAFALRFNGTSDYVLTPIKHDGKQPFTLEAWVMLDADSSSGCILANQLGGGFRIRTGKYFARFYMVPEAGEAKIAIQDNFHKPGVIIPIGKPIHIAAVYDTKEMRLYIDGKQHAPGQQLGQLKVSTAPILIGADPQSADLTKLDDHFGGTIDEVRISKVARYSAPFAPATHFQPDADTMALYHFDEGRGEVAHDASGNNRHARIVGAKWVRKSAGMIDLLPLIDPAKHSFKKTPWEKRDGTLVSPVQHRWARIVVPYAPPPEYELTAEVERLDGARTDAFAVGLIAGGRKFSLCVDNSPRVGGIICLGRYKKAEFHHTENAVKGKYLLLPGKRVTLRYVVQRDRLTLYADGEKVFDWNPADYANCEVWHHTREVPTNYLNLSTYESAIAIHRLELKPLSASLIAPSAAPHVDCGWVRLVNRMSDRCVGVNGASTEPRASLHQYDPVHGAHEQHWRIESSDEPGLYRLKNRKSGLYVTLKQPRQGEGYLQRPLEDDNNEFLFSIMDIDGKWFRIVSHESKLDAGIWGSSMREGEWIIQWPFSSGGTDRYWRVEPVDEAGEHGWIDVLAQMNPQQHSVFGTWRRDGSRLVCEPLDFTRIGSPVYATGNYEVEAQFRWIGKVGEVNLLLPVGVSAVHVWVKSGSGGIGQFTGAEPAPPAETWTYEADRRYTIAATVRVDGATATVKTRMDGEPYAEWSGPVESLYPRSDWMLPNRTLGFGAHVCNVSLEGLRVRPLEDGQLLRKTYRLEPVESEPGQTIELAALVDPARHAVLGKWEVADGAIACVEPREFARVAIPLVPHGDYELSGTLLRLKGLSPATLAIPVGGSYTGLEIKDKAVVLERMGGAPPWKRADVQMGPETQFAVRVEHQGDIAKIHVAIDGKPALDWEGPTVAAQPRFDWVLTPPSLGLGTHGGLLAVKDLKFKLLSGTAERIVEEIEPIPDSQSAVGQSGSEFPAEGTAEEQKAWVITELERLNPEAEGRISCDILDGRIVGVMVHDKGVTDISPLASLTHLRSVDLMGCSRLADLSPLAGLPLETVVCHYTSVADLSPLEGMKLRKLWIGETQVSDLLPLAGMPLEDLYLRGIRVSDLSVLRGMKLKAFECGFTAVSDLSSLEGMPLESLCAQKSRVSDLSPLRGLPLRLLHVEETPISDLAPLKGLPLANLDIRKTNVSDLSPLADLPLVDLSCNLVLDRDVPILLRIATLKTINGKPAAGVLGGTKPLPFPADGTAEEKKAWVLAEVKRLNPEYDGAPRFTFAKGDIVGVEVRGREIRDLRPFAPLRKLRVLLCNDSSVSDISPLAGMPLEELRLYGARVSDFGPLKGMPLKTADLCHASVGDLSPLAGMPLETLGLYAVQAVDFSPLKGMPLKDLNVGSTRFSDLTLLKGMPLEALCILGTPIRDLSGLKGLPLKSLTCHSTHISDLSPLAGMSFISLDLLNMPVADLSPLTGMPLRFLRLDGTRVVDLSPLKGIPLEKFQMANTLISDLGPLVGSPLRWLTCNGTRVKDFSPLKDTPLLSISCDVRPEDVAALRQIRTLKTINDRPAADVLREAEENMKQADVLERPESRSEQVENPSGEPPKDTASTSEKPADAPQADDKSARGRE